MNLQTRANNSCAASAIFSAFSVCACCCQLTETERNNAMSDAGVASKMRLFRRPDDQILIAFQRGAEQRFRRHKQHHIIQRVRKLPRIIAVASALMVSFNFAACIASDSARFIASAASSALRKSKSGTFASTMMSRSPGRRTIRSGFDVARLRLLA